MNEAMTAAATTAELATARTTANGNIIRMHQPLNLLWIKVHTRWLSGMPFKKNAFHKQALEFCGR